MSWMELEEYRQLFKECEDKGIEVEDFIKFMKNNVVPILKKAGQDDLE